MYTKTNWTYFLNETNWTVKAYWKDRKRKELERNEVSYRIMKQMCHTCKWNQTTIKDNESAETEDRAEQTQDMVQLKRINVLAKNTSFRKIRRI